MGTWGTRVNDDDFASDVIAEYFEQYDKGVTPTEIRANLEQKFSTEIKDSDDGYIFWLALAKAQWDIGDLDADVKARVQEIVELKIDTKAWQELGATLTDIKKREESIRNFLTRIQRNREKPRKRKKQVSRSSPFELGTVLVFGLKDGDYGAAVVVSVEKETRFGLTGVVELDIKQNTKPKLDEILNANILIQRWQIGDTIQATYYYAQSFKRSKELFESIGKIKVRKLTEEIKSYTPLWANVILRPEKDIKSTRQMSLKEYAGYKPNETVEVE